MGLSDPQIKHRITPPLMATCKASSTVSGRNRALTVMSTLVVLLALFLTQTLATEVHPNSGRNGESTSQTSVVVTESAPKGVTEDAVAIRDSDSSDLDKAETKDPTKKLDIIKQIRKINKDGSYTVGYEAGDGTFKIESRDVLGNIKGTYGYVDANGEIKRVSYNGNNGTSALKNFPDEVANNETNNNDEQEELSTTLPNVNAGKSTASNNRYPAQSSTRRPPSLKFLSTTPSSNTFGPKSNYIQTIPKRRLGVPSSTERSLYSHYATAKTTPRPHKEEVISSTTRTPSTAAAGEEQTPTTIVYAKTVPTQKPLIILRPTTQATSTSQTQEQISRPDKLEINHVSKVMVMKSSETSTSKSVSQDKENDRKSIRGNNLRRQLAQEREDHYEAQPQHLYSQAAGEDSAHIFDGSTGNLRPLYSTNPRPRVPSIVLAARQRAAQLQSALNTNSPASTPEKVYVRPPPANVQYETTTEPSQDSNYLTQSPSATVVQIPANQGISHQATEDQGSIYRQRPAPFSVRQHQAPLGHAGQYQGTESPNSLFRFPPPPSARGEQFLRETTPASTKHHRDDVDETVYGRQSQQRPRGPYDSEAGFQQGSYPIPYQQNPYGFYPGAGGPAPSPYNFPQRPVTGRDFEMLLQLLVNRHQQPRFGGGGVGGYGGFNSYGGYNPGIGPYLPNPYQGFQQYPRSQLYDPVGFDPRYGGGVGQFGGFRQFSEPQNSAVYAGQGSQGLAVGQSQQQQPYDVQRGGLSRQQSIQQPYNANYYGTNTSPSAINAYQSPARAPIPQSQYYQPEYANTQQSYATQASTQQDYLPSEVREDLLYRMLMLAIQSPNGGGGVAGGDSQQQPHIGAFSDPIKSVITPIVATTGEEGASVPASAHHHQNHPHHNHRSNSVQTATRKPVRSVQILGEAEE